MDNVVEAVNCKLMAVNFWESAKKIESTMDKKDDGTPAKLTAIPFYFLVSHATELFLKAALLKRGFDSGKLKKFDYRHNLSNLLDELEKYKIVVSPHSASIIRGLSISHAEHSLRYKVLVKWYSPPPKCIYSMLDELLGCCRLNQ